MIGPRALAAILPLVLCTPEIAGALPLRIRPRLGGRSLVGVRARARARAPTARVRERMGGRRRSRVRDREATLGDNPPRRSKDTGLEDPDHIRHQDELVSRAETLARERGDELLGPAVAYYRTSQGRLIRVVPNSGTGNLRLAARLRPGENLARLEQVGFATRNSDRLLRVSREGSSSRLAVLGGNRLRALGGVAGTAALIFGRDLLRWIGIRNGADAIQGRVVPEEPPGPEIVIDREGQIHIDGDGDGRQELEVQGQPGGVRVGGEEGGVVVEEGTVRGEDGQVRISPTTTKPYGLP